MEPMTLKDFLGKVKGRLDANFPLQYWITAEIAVLRVNPNSRHCYIDLIEKDEEAVLAKAGGVIWKGRLDYIREKFSGSTGQQLREGMKVMLLVEILFHEVYGFKLNIGDIDPSYTLGEFALHRKKILARLEKEKLLGLNKSISLPAVIQRIAVISSPSAAGYEDFINTLNNNPYGYVFTAELFPAYMQGDQTEESIAGALQDCLSREKPYDAVIIIRGGGDKSDLHGFDSYKLGRAIALLPLPVITGIGHRRDETVVDIVAHTKHISPTAVAEFLIGRMRDFEEGLDDSSRRLVNRVQSLISREKDSLKTAEKHFNIFSGFFIRSKKEQFRALAYDFTSNVSKRIASNGFMLKEFPLSLSRLIHSYLKNHAGRLDRKKDFLLLVEPSNVLKRGYTLTLHKGKILRGAASLKAGDIIETRFSRGSAESAVQKVENGGRDEKK